MNGETLTTVPSWHGHYEALYRDHASRVARLCRLLLDDPQEAQEVAQEVFLKVARAYQGSRQPAAWGPWLTTVTLNACRDRRRSGWWKWRHTKVEIIESTEIVDRGPTPERTALDRETRAKIWRTFRQLSHRQREVFLLRYVEGWSTEEVARALGLSGGSVKRHLFRAAQRLRKALGGEP
jgi:RNA polymerase sigma-70 factor (ECF subfamily)